MDTPDSHADEGGCSSHESRPSQPSSQSSQPWVRYRVEYRSVVTNELVDQKSTRDPKDKLWNDDHLHAEGWPVFEVVRTIRVQDAGPEKSRYSNIQHTTPLAATLAPSYGIRIYSIDIINAIQSVVKYYPGQDLTGDSVFIRWPYPILVHHYEELEAFLSGVKELEPEKRCSRERNVNEHLRLLLDYLDDNVMADVRKEKERNERRSSTFQWLWVSMRPGMTVVDKLDNETEPYAYVIHSLEGGSFTNPSRPWVVKYWRMEFDGEYLGRKIGTIDYDRWDGESNFGYTRRSVHVPEERGDKTLDDTELDDDIKRFIRRGETYWELLTKQCQWYSGATVDFPYNQVDTNVMIDVEACLVGRHVPKPFLMDDRDLRQWTSDCTCGVCNMRRAMGGEAQVPLFDDYNHISPKSDKEKELTWHHMLLCPEFIPAFIFRTRTWGKFLSKWIQVRAPTVNLHYVERLYIQHLSEPKFNPQMIESLVMDPIQLRRLKALAQSFARIDKDGNQLVHQSWSADFVKGKGKGLIFLLHGRPGVGKTCTAGIIESIAEFMKKPLMVLTCSDIGTDPVEVEENLTREFKKAKSWGAVLLIDEADVFMERRSTKDLTRNSLVAGFLRALEFYDGILFLTTNRVGAFDDAFISRIHIQLYYPDFTDDQRQQVWQTFVEKLKRDCGSYMKLDSTAKSYLKSKEVRAMKWNGRDIRNAFQTAVSLAEYDAEKGDDGKVLVNDDHFRAVVELSSDFRKYLDTLHKKDEAQRAAFKHERYDEFVKDQE
ncbi:hypothetical protein NM208_g2189 [Fusarium decemcellulare]|uniref:Uncharacterized protein n=1 Tax=Fusarium decemcellulare TaxID=57161 RepID=A0ACC1STH6_9HYPO|nr:hypothetical protein NM208_g2189 [Fusarium decemcellulare]